jgi:hypothetical protein
MKKYLPIIVAAALIVAGVIVIQYLLSKKHTATPAQA